MDRSFFRPNNPFMRNIKEVSTSGGKESIRIYESCIGKGKVSTTHLGLHCTGTHVAMKVYPRPWAKLNIVLVERERKFLIKFKEYVPQMVFDPMQTANFVYFPLEFFNCGSLQNAMRPGLQFPLDIMQKLGRFLAEVLRALQENKVVHGSIRPSHILIRVTAGEPIFKLTGFKSAEVRPDAEADSEIFYPDVCSVGLILYDIAVGCSHEKVDKDFVEIFRKTGKLPLPEGPNPMDPTLTDLVSKLLTCANGKTMPVKDIFSHPFFKLTVIVAPEKPFFTSPTIDFSKSYKRYKEMVKDTAMEDLPEYPDLQEYVVGKFLTETDYAKVYECTKKGRKYDIEVVSPEITDEGFYNLLEEIQLHRKLRNIPTTLEYIDYFTFNNRLYVVKEALSEVTLYHYIKQHVNGKGYTLKSNDIKTIVINVSLGIKAMHENNMALRDFRPMNFLISQNDDGSVKALKLKLLRRLFVGSDSVEFVAPELVLKKVNVEKLSIEEGKKIDTWSFGELLHFVCYGVPVYDTVEKCQQFAGAVPSPNAEFPAELHSIMKECLNPNPDARPSVLDILKNQYFATGFPVVPEGLIPYTLGRRITRRTNLPTMVCECFDEAGKKYIMKMINYVHLCLSEDKGKVHREAEIMKSLSALNVPHVIKMECYSLINGILYTVLEYANGGDLHAYLKNRIKEGRPLTLEEQEFVVRQVLKPLVAMHEGGIVHGDLHAKNVLVCVEGKNIEEVKLGDFGFARLLSQCHAPEKATELLSFVSPELYKPKDQIDYKKVDVWGFGMLIFFVLYGFHASEYFVSFDVKSDKSLSFPKETYPVSKTLKQAMMMCLDKSPQSTLTLNKLQSLLSDKK